MANLLGLVPLLSGLVIGFLYPFFIIPAFFSGTTTTRLLIALVLHPILLESAEAMGRSTSAQDVFQKLQSGKINLQQAERMVVEGSLGSFATKQLMAFFRRLMLLDASTCESGKLHAIPHL